MSAWFYSTVVGTILFAVGSFLLEKGKFDGLSNDKLLFGLYFTGTIGFAFVLEIQIYQFSLNEILMGLTIGITSLIMNIIFVNSFKYGPPSLGAVLMNINIIFIILMSVILYNEKLPQNVIIGIVIILVSLSILPFDKKKDLTITSNLWYWMIALIIFFKFIRNGGLKIAQESAMNNTVILFIVYLVGLIWFIFRLSCRNNLILGFDSLGYIYGGLSGIFCFIGMKTFADALAVGPASLIVTISTALDNVVFAFLSIIFCREKITKIQFIVFLGVLLGITMLRN